MKSEEMERDRGTKGEISTLDALIEGKNRGEECREVKKRKGVEAQRVKTPTMMR